MDVTKKRNIVIVGHAHSGKTSLTESLLSTSGTTSRKGDVLQGTTMSDFYSDEKERQISINASCLNLTHAGHTLQILDTPGYSDFVGEIISSVKVSDAAVVVVDAFNGVEVGTEDVWQRLEDEGLPRIVFINKEDKDEADVAHTIDAIKEQLSPKVVRIDLSSSDLIESVAESNDALLEKYLEEGSLPEAEIAGALRQAVLDAKVFPLFVGSALNDKGVKELLDAITTYFPCPLERKPFKGKVPGADDITEIIPSKDGLFVGFIFKSMYDAHLGQLSLMRVLRGQIGSNTDVYNATAGSKEHIGTMSVMQGKEQSNAPQAVCGDIVALAKLKHTHAGNTLCDPKEKIIMAPIEFPEPAISASIKPKTRADEEKITASLTRLCEEDRTFKVFRNAETKELIISGVGDLHLKIMLDRMQERYHVEVDLGKPKVSYRETITRPGKARYKHKKQSGGRGQYADVDLEVKPKEIEAGQYEFVNKIFGGAIPRNYIPSVEKGVKQTVSQGVLAEYPLYNIEVTVVDGSYHDVDSSDMAFQIASSHAMKDAIKSASPVLLEPIMEVAIVVSDEYIGQISGDINSRRGRIMGTGTKGKKEVIKALVPLSEMFSYATDLRSMTGGRGSYTMKMSHYDQAPMKITEKVVAESQSAKAEAAA